MPNLRKYLAERLLAVDFTASPSNPLTILDLTKIPSGSVVAAEEFTRINKILPGLNDRDSCLRIGFPGYIGPCEADDRVSVGDRRELVLYDFNFVSNIRFPTAEEIAFIEKQLFV